MAGLGTGGTLMGTGRRLKEHNPNVQIVAAEPHPDDSVSGLRSLDHGFIPPILDLEMLDRKVVVRSDDSLKATRDLVRVEGVFSGLSGGAVLNVGLRVASQMERGTIVLLLADGGLEVPLDGPVRRIDEAATEGIRGRNMW